MPWNDQSGGGGQKPPGGSNGGPNSGGPWGDGPRQPWGQPPKRPDAPPPGGPDLEEMMRRFQDRMRGGRGRGGGVDGGRPFGPAGFAVLGALLVAGWFASGVYVVDTGEQGIVTRFGAFDRATGPGLHVHLPPPLENVRVEQVTRQRRVQIGFDEGQDKLSESLMLTRDESIVDIDFTVVWSLKDAKDFVFNTRNPEDMVFAVSESAMREVVGQRTLEAIITRDRGAVEDATKALMQRTLDSYKSGILINQVQLQSATAPQVVIEAFDDVVRASQDADTKINEATKYQNEVVPQARGEAARMIQESEAYKERVVREANGEAERFRLIQEQYKGAPRVTRERLYLETMERIYGGADKIIVDGRTGVTPYLPLDQLRRQQAGQGAPTAPPAPNR
ncbi:MAG: FtsH protease activity modulator HflK [Alphaproteobacteria bacterium]|nr:FtsH protease activity modulator HflK [Alphaproteobacteria bacterium]